uniref:Uncharacterized protein n=1 Tax=Solanum lycopersicum TaxID=4081 RepID=A0A3Q7F129_SOLLC
FSYKTLFSSLFFTNHKHRQRLFSWLNFSLLHHNAIRMDNNGEDEGGEE